MMLTKQFQITMLIILLQCATLTCSITTAAEKQDIVYGRDVRPILADRCFTCHGPDRAGQENDLRLDLRVHAIKSAIVAGNSNKSELLHRISSKEPEMQMPPAHSGKKPLTQSEIAILKSWIDAGAKYEKHWAYTTPNATEPPTVNQPAWSQTAIDRFLFAEMQQQKLSPAKRANRRTLIRRLSFDLTGLPPTPEAVRKFIADDNEQAYEKLVDRLLSTPQFGERMAAYWLDLVRYADTGGYHSDNAREVDAYRDYVIHAFNNNLPFNQFTTEQLAGDLLPRADLMQKVASGYNRLLQTTEEGGAQAKEYMAIYAADRVRNVSTVWLASTMGCAQCHDHKFDPFTMKDFYSLAAFFADIKERPVGRQPANLRLPSAEQNATLAKLRKQIAQTNALTVDRDALDAWVTGLEQKLANSAQEWQIAAPKSVKSKNGTTLTKQEDLSFLASGKNPNEDDYLISVALKANQTVTGFRLEALTHKSLVNKSLSRANGNFVLTNVAAELKTGKARQPVRISSAAADYEQPGWPVAHTLDENPKTGWAANGHMEVKNRTAVFLFAEPLKTNAESELYITLQHHSAHSRHNIGRFRISLTSAEKPSIQGGPDISPDIVDVIKTEQEKRTEKQNQQLVTHFKTKSPAWKTHRDNLAAWNKQIAAIEKSIRTMLVSESTKPREMRILPRGNWLDDSGELVTPQVPISLGVIENSSSETQLTRLDLAQWLTDERNPLTARVFVNRVWMLLFGNGIVRSLEDFGHQGRWPTHAKLLDWLAVDFMQHDWNVKRLIKQIVMTEAYRQSSVSTPALRERDPLNEALARQSRFRFDAEMVRDNALFVSQLLVDDQGGRSVKPYQPAGYWKHLNFPARKWTHNKDQNLYRRGLYTFWCRSFLHPSLQAFDAPSREECTAKRPRSNTPLQALVLLNDPTYVEAARALATRLVKEVPEDSNRRIVHLYNIVLQREPSAAELQILKTVYDQQAMRFQQAKQDATALLSVGESNSPAEIAAEELATWTTLSRVVLNLHETITRN